MDLDDLSTDFAAAFAAGQASSPAVVQTIEGVPVLITREGTGAHKVTSYERWLPRPMRRAGTVTCHRLPSLLAYLRAYGGPSTLITIDGDKLVIAAVLDYHEHGPEGAPAWGEHRVTFQARLTPEWETWRKASGQRMTQAQFAAFLEDNLPDIASPDGAVIYEMARTIEAAKSAKFASAVRLQNGQTQLAYEETIQARAGEKGALAIVDEFVLGLAPFDGAARYELRARFRYRINDEGGLALWVDLLRPHKVIEAAFDDLVTQVTAAFPDWLIVHGARANGHAQ